MTAKAVSIIRYGAGTIKWTKEELRKLDRKTRRLLTINRALHPKTDIDRFSEKIRG